MKLIRIEWQDLLRVPFLADGDDPTIGLDCWGLAREIARRAGIAFPDVGKRPTAHAALHAAAFRRVMRWEEVGDVIVSDPLKRGYVTHVSTVVDTGDGLALSTSERAGPFCWPIHRIHQDLGVWRVNLTA